MQIFQSSAGIIEEALLNTEFGIQRWKRSLCSYYFISLCTVAVENLYSPQALSVVDFQAIKVSFKITTVFYCVL